MRRTPLTTTPRRQPRQGTQQQTRRPQLLLSIHGTDRRTDAQPFRRPVNYAVSVKTAHLLTIRFFYLKIYRTDLRQIYSVYKTRGKLQRLRFTYVTLVMSL